ncbi:OPT superfamily oligopeptide transporter [Mollisia scopiformis]|uniref:OPT superfamily oligopeptide transporter n=1 Tax=Mollisia scopiformis TaxID=149040 RepID=A0A194X1F7_MOLSC|nr:OPT superfamily oligopeptide transporter [Mollisia scopiformis]KUJ14031.1 OPT superfamily oligopeptide transporter [Mollisia scopiformis]
MYFGMQVGSVNTISPSTALISFAIFKSPDQWLAHVFTPAENVVVQTIASSIAGMPIAASMLSVVPAFEFLRRPEEGGQRHFSITELILWSLGVSLFGTVFAAPFRKYFLLWERLRFPGGFATGVLIGALHKDGEIAYIADLDKKGLSFVDSDRAIDAAADDAGDDASPDLSQTQSHLSSTSHVAIILKAFCGTTIYIFVSYFIPILNALPVFGPAAAGDWLWFLTLSPAFTAFGMILDLSVAYSIVLGAILGWGILSPIAKNHGWAPGLATDMETGVRGWLIWISIAFLLGDAMIRALHGLTSITLGLYNSIRSQPGQFCIGCCYPLRFVTYLVFGREIPLYLIVTAVAIAFPLCLVVIQSTGETDTVPLNSLSNACQFLFLLMLFEGAGAKLATMIAGAITEAGLWQSAVLMTDLKTAYLVRASPRVMFHAQLLGSVIGCFIGSVIYRTFTAVYSIPSKEFSIPLAHMWVNTARLAKGGDLPKGVVPFAIAALFILACLRAICITAGQRRWTSWLPSGVAISIGMYVPPSVTLAKFIGAGLRLYFMRWWAVSELTLMAAATDYILSEGTLGFVPMTMAALGIPRLM